MADDNLGLGGEDPGQKGEESKTASIDLDQLNEQITKSLEESLSPVMGEIGKAVRATNERIDNLSEKPKEEDPNEKIQALLENPDDVIAEHIARFTEKDKPLIGAIVADRRATHERAEEAEFDTEYGEGKYKELIAPVANGMLDNYPAQFLVQRSGVAAVVAQVKGGMVNELVKLKVENDSKKEAERKNEYSSIGSGRPTPDPKRGLNDDEKLLLEKFSEAGFDDMDEKAYLKSKNTEPTLSGYLKSIKKESQNAR
jgi:hypothetical protein